MPTAAKKKPASHFQQFWMTKGEDLFRHCGAEDPREFARVCYNAGAGLAIDHARAAVNDSWREIVEPVNRSSKKAANPEETDFMQAKPVAEVAPIAVQTDLTGEDEPIERKTIRDLFE